MSDSVHNVVLVGHCGPDAHLLASAAQRALPGARVETVNDRRGLSASLARATLLLVNRVLEGDLGSSGVELIRSLNERSGGSGPPAMLISNFEDAQREAEGAGAHPGFGKRSVMSDEAKEKIRQAVGLEV